VPIGGADWTHSGSACWRWRLGEKETSSRPVMCSGKMAMVQSEREEWQREHGMEEE
jgi:hypothetical protein